jgi:hypothetical protein
MQNVEGPELVNLIFSTVFFIVLLSMIRKRVHFIPDLFIAGTLLVLLSNFFTVAESFLFSALFNVAEHISFTIGTLCFCLGSINLLRKDG